MFRNRRKVKVKQHPRHTKNGITIVRRHGRNIMASNQPIKDTSNKPFLFKCEVCGGRAKMKNPKGFLGTEFMCPFGCKACYVLWNNNGILEAKCIIRP